MSGTRVFVEPFGVGAGEGRCTTDATGQCTFTFTAPNPGPGGVTACADANRNGRLDATDPCGTGTVLFLRQPGLVSCLLFEDLVFHPEDPTNTNQVSATCDPEGTSTIRWRTTGIATGPYFGTFEAEGVATIGPHPLSVFGAPGGFLTSFEERFTIRAEDVIITGTKRLAAEPGPEQSMATCSDVTSFDEPFFTDIDGYSHQLSSGNLVYEATISAPEGTRRDSGRAGIFVSELSASYDDVFSGQRFTVFASDFAQGFLSTNCGPLLPNDCDVKGNGFLADGSHFNVHALSDARRGISGHVVYQDGPSKLHLQKSRITGVACACGVVNIQGEGEVDRRPVTFDVQLTDGGAEDTFAITWAGGSTYAKGGPVTKGDAATGSCP